MSFLSASEATKITQKALEKEQRITEELDRAEQLLKENKLTLSDYIILNIRIDIEAAAKRGKTSCLHSMVRYRDTLTTENYFTKLESSDPEWSKIKEECMNRLNQQGYKTDPGVYGVWSITW